MSILYDPLKNNLIDIFNRKWIDSYIQKELIPSQFQYRDYVYINIDEFSLCLYLDQLKVNLLINNNDNDDDNGEEYKI